MSKISVTSITSFSETFKVEYINTGYNRRCFYTREKKKDKFVKADPHDQSSCPQITPVQCTLRERR